MKLQKSVWILVSIVLLVRDQIQAKPIPEGEGEEEEGEEEEDEDVYEEEDEVTTSTTTTTTAEHPEEIVHTTEDANHEKNDELEVEIIETTIKPLSVDNTTLKTDSNSTTEVTASESNDSIRNKTSNYDISTEVILAKNEMTEKADLSATKAPQSTIRVIMLKLATGENVTIHIAGGGVKEPPGQINSDSGQNMNIEAAIIKALQASRNNSNANETGGTRNDIQVMMENFVEEPQTTVPTPTTSTTTISTVSPLRLGAEITSSTTTEVTTTNKSPALYEASYFQRKTTTPLPTVYQAFKKLIQTQWFKNEVVNVGCFGFGFCDEEWKNLSEGKVPTDNNDDD